MVGEARFHRPRTLTVDLEAGGERTLTADRVVLATGSRPVVPPIDGLEELGGADHGCVHTSDSIMRLDALPRGWAVVGGGYVGSEFADVFHSSASRCCRSSPPSGCSAPRTARSPTCSPPAPPSAGTSAWAPS